MRSCIDYTGLGSITALSDSTGEVVERYRYDSFGTPTILGSGQDGLMDTADDVTLTVSAYGNPFLFTGREWDAETGLYHYRRSYDPSTGRFLQEDPLSIANGVSPYSYVGNDPINLTDPLGLDSALLRALARRAVASKLAGTCAAALAEPSPIGEILLLTLGAYELYQASRIGFPEPFPSTWNVPGPQTGSPLKPGEFRPGPSKVPDWMKWILAGAAGEKAIEQTLRYWRDLADEEGFKN